MKYGKADPKTLNDEKYLKDIKWKEEDLKNMPKVDLLESVTIVGDIQPPLTENEIEALALGPKFCLTPKLTNEEMEIALAENKVKRIWNDIKQKYVDDEQSDEDEDESIEELDAKMRRVYDFDKNEINLGNLRVTDANFNRRTILPENRNKKIEAQENLRKENAMRTFQEYKYEYCNDKGKALEKNITKTKN